MAQRAKRKPVESGRQAEVLAIAAELFARNGYATTTVRDIADAAGILSGSLYHHFASKGAMVDEILRSFVDALLDDYDAVLSSELPPRELLRALVNATLSAIEDHRAASAIYQSDGRRLAGLDRFGYLLDAERRFEQTWTTALRRGVDAGDLRGGRDPQLAYRFIRSSLWSAGRWHEPDGALTSQQVADEYLAILLDGLAKPRKKKSGKKG